MKKKGLIVSALFLLLPFMLVLFMFQGNSSSETEEEEIKIETGTQNISPEVLKWKDEIEAACKKYNIPDYSNVVMAIIMVESGGSVPDLMQSSESLGLPMNTIKSEKESIDAGVKHLAKCVQLAKEQGTDFWSAVGAYNFGSNYINFLAKNGKKHTIELADKYSLTVVAPSLGNMSGSKYVYSHPVAIAYNGGFLYWNGGNFFYVSRVQEYLTSSGGSSGSSGNAIELLESVLGQYINNGQCYGLTAYYVEKMGGPVMMGSGFVNASDIGSDYDWQKYGWEVVYNPKIGEIKSGDVINWNQDPVFATTVYGHTGIVKSVNVSKNSFTAYEQNAGKGQIVAVYDRNWIPTISSVVRKK